MRKCDIVPQVHPGPEGYQQFTEAIRRAFCLPDDSELNITFTCDEPTAVDPLAPPAPAPPPAPPPPPPLPSPPRRAPETILETALAREHAAAPSRACDVSCPQPGLCAWCTVTPEPGLPGCNLPHKAPPPCRFPSSHLAAPTGVSRTVAVLGGAAAHTTVNFCAAVGLPEVGAAGGSLLTLQGAGAYDAAVHCASVSAARRLLQQRYMGDMLQAAGPYRYAPPGMLEPLLHSRRKDQTPKSPSLFTVRRAACPKLLNRQPPLVHHPSSLRTAQALATPLQHRPAASPHPPHARAPHALLAFTASKFVLTPVLRLRLSPGPSWGPVRRSQHQTASSARWQPAPPPQTAGQPRSGCQLPSAASCVIYATCCR